MRFDGRGTTTYHNSPPKLHCECLSPLVVRKEVSNLLRGTDHFVLEQEPPDPSVATFVQYLRLKQPAIFWNVVWHMINTKLPLSFLLGKEDASVHTPNTHKAQARQLDQPKPTPRRMLSGFSAMAGMFSTTAQPEAKHVPDHTAAMRT